MGVPAFFKWLTLRYPKVILDAIEDAEEAIVDENEIALEQELFGRTSARLNPEFDNLYLDMNGIVHPCTHPQNGVGHLEVKPNVAPTDDGS